MTSTPPLHAKHDHPAITAVILAGGRARRMGGEDKGLVAIAGRTMVEHILAALRPQVDAIIINANRNLERYEALAAGPVVADEVGDFAGPLAGMLSAMTAARTPLILTVPCDSPIVCTDLAARLLASLRTALPSGDSAELAVAHDGTRLQPVFALLDRSLEQSLRDYMASGERKIDRWYEQHRMVRADLSDQPDTFLNINTPAERDDLEQRLLHQGEARSGQDTTTVDDGATS